jgi:DNA-binding GntR family transcriptional regulator
MHLSDKAYAQLKRLILSGRFGPDAVLSERSLAKLLSVSRVPVREAIKALEREGLLFVVPQSGVHLRRLSADEVRELYELRQAVEGMAACLCAARGRRSEIAPLRIRLATLLADGGHDHAAIQQTSRAFHRALLELCGNSQLDALYRTLEPKIEVNLRLTAVHAPERVEQALHEHLAIAQAIERGAAEEAERLMRIHLENGKTARIGILNHWNDTAEPANDDRAVDGSTALGRRSRQ